MREHIPVPLAGSAGPDGRATENKETQREIYRAGLMPLKILNLNILKHKALPGYRDD